MTNIPLIPGHSPGRTNLLLSRFPLPLTRLRLGHPTPPSQLREPKGPPRRSQSISPRYQRTVPQTTSAKMLAPPRSHARIVAALVPLGCSPNFLLQSWRRLSRRLPSESLAVGRALDSFLMHPRRSLMIRPTPECHPCKTPLTRWRRSNPRLYPLCPHQYGKAKPTYHSKILRLRKLSAHPLQP